MASARRSPSSVRNSPACSVNQYYVAGALYGPEPSDAYSVDVGPAVNTEETIANGELHAVLRVRMSPFAELVVIEIVKYPTTEALPAAA